MGKAATLCICYQCSNYGFFSPSLAGIHWGFFHVKKMSSFSSTRKQWMNTSQRSVKKHICLYISRIYCKNPGFLETVLCKSVDTAATSSPFSNGSVCSRCSQPGLVGLWLIPHTYENTSYELQDISNTLQETGAVPVLLFLNVNVRCGVLVQC